MYGPDHKELQSETANQLRKIIKSMIGNLRRVYRRRLTINEMDNLAAIAIVQETGLNYERARRLTCLILSTFEPDIRPPEMVHICLHLCHSFRVWELGYLGVEHDDAIRIATSELMAGKPVGGDLTYYQASPNVRGKDLTEL